MPSVVHLSGHKISTAARSADIPFLSPTAEHSQQIWQRFTDDQKLSRKIDEPFSQKSSFNYDKLHLDRGTHRTKRSENLETQEYITQNVSASWWDFYVQMDQEMRANQVEETHDPIRPTIIAPQADTDSTSPFTLNSFFSAREMTIDWLLKVGLPHGATIPALDPFQRMAIANQILSCPGENFKNLLFYESFSYSLNADHINPTQNQNEHRRVAGHLDQIQTALPAEMFNRADLWVNARTNTILSSVGIDHFDAVTPCQKIYNIKTFTAIFRPSDPANQGPALPNLKVQFEFPHQPRICEMQSGRRMLVLPNGELIDYDATRQNDQWNLHWWDHLAFALKLLPILPREVIQEQALLGNRYQFSKWQPSIKESTVNPINSMKECIESGVRAYLEQEPSLQKAADLILPQTASELKNKNGGLELAFSLHAAGIPWGNRSKAAILSGVEAMKNLTGSAKWQAGLQATMSTLYNTNQTCSTNYLSSSFPLPTTQEVLDTARRTGIEGFQKLEIEVKRLARKLCQDGAQETIEMPTQEPPDTQTLPSIPPTNTTVSVQETTETTTFENRMSSLSTTISTAPIDESNLLAAVPVATMKQLLDTDAARSDDLLAYRNSLVYPIQDPLQYERAKTLLNLEISNWAAQTNQQNLTRAEMIDGYLSWQETAFTNSENFTLPDLTVEDLLAPSTYSFLENGTAAENLTIPGFRAKDIVSINNEQWINLRLDVQGMLEGLLQTEPIQSFSNDTSESSLFTVCVEAVRYLAGVVGNKLTPSKSMTIRNQILDLNSTLYSPQSATALVHLESNIWAIESQNEHLSSIQRSYFYLEHLNNTDPFLPLTNATVPVNSTIDFELDLPLFPKGSLPHARAQAYEALFGEATHGLSQMEMIEAASELLNPEKEGYDENLAKEFLVVEALTWGEEALADGLTKEEVLDAYARKLFALANPLQIPDFLPRQKIAEQYVDENYGGERLYNFCVTYGTIGTQCKVVDRVQEAMNWGGINGVDKRFNSQLNMLFSEGPNSPMMILSEESFTKTGLPYSELIRPVRRSWIIRDFEPLYWKNLKGRIIDKSELKRNCSGIYQYPGHPTLFETAKGRFGVVLPNAEIFLYDQPPFDSTGKVNRQAVAKALGLEDLDGQPYTYTWSSGRSIQWNFKRWSMSVEDESTLAPLQTLIERNLRKKLNKALGDLEQSHYSATGFQTFCFAIFPFVELIVNKANGAHSKPDAFDVLFEILDLAATLASLGVPLTKGASGAAKSVRTATKGLTGVAKTRASIRTFFSYMSQHGYTQTIGREAIDYFIPIFTASDLIKAPIIGSKKLIQFIRKHVDDLRKSRGLGGIRASHIICRRGLDLLCLPHPEAMKRFGQALAELEEPLRDVIFEQARKSNFHPDRKKLKAESFDHIAPLREKLEQAKTNKQDKIAIKKAYQDLGQALLEEERLLFSKAKKTFQDALDVEFTKLQKEIPSATREEYILDFPNPKLELDTTETALKGKNPVIRISADGEPRHTSFFLRFIQSVIGKDPAQHRVFYKVQTGDLEFTLKYMGEKPGYRGTDPYHVYVGNSKRIEYSEITDFFNGPLLRALNNDQTEVVKVIREFSDTSYLPDALRNLPIRHEAKEKLSAFEGITKISEEQRTPGTGSMVERLLQELYHPQPKSFLDITEKGITERLTFSKIFNKETPLVSFIAPRKKGVNYGTKAWRMQHYGPDAQRIKASIAKRKLNPDNVDLLSGDERELVMGLNRDTIFFQSPIKKPKQADLDSSRKKRSPEFKAPATSSPIAPVTGEKGPSWKKVAAISIPIVLHVGPAAVAIAVPVAIYGTVQWFKNRSQTNTK